MRMRLGDDGYALYIERHDQRNAVAARSVDWRAEYRVVARMQWSIGDELHQSRLRGREPILRAGYCSQGALPGG